MSSSASQSNGSTTVVYKGKVYATKKFADECAISPELQSLKEAFKQFWTTGRHPDFGKDVAYGRPAEIRSLHIRHTHIDNGDYVDEDSEKNKSAKESFWILWKQKTEQAKVVPTSNSYLVYAVNHQRDAALLSYLSDDAHETSELSEYTEDLIRMAYSFYSNSKSTAMPLEEDLFSDKWKI